ncbi:MAG: fabF, partial [Paucimonas sp.]|nr:fabF [Paucimonas sp.]
GALECAITVLALKEQKAPPTMHLHMPDPECDLDYVANRARGMDTRVALSNSFAFGGTNAVLALGAISRSGIGLS